VRVALAPSKNAAEWLRSALVEPFADFLTRYGKQALLILALIGVYRISDVVMGIMANPFYVDMGYTKDELTGHGFRSMASTLLNEQGWNRDAIERQLAHAERDNIRAAYNYAEFLPERRKMMQASPTAKMALTSPMWMNRLLSGGRIGEQANQVHGPPKPSTI